MKGYHNSPDITYKGPRCDVYGCYSNHPVVTMSWPEELGKRSLNLCAEDEAYYRSIAGKHMIFTPITEHEGSMSQ